MSILILFLAYLLHEKYQPFLPIQSISQTFLNGERVCGCGSRVSYGLTSICVCVCVLVLRGHGNADAENLWAAAHTELCRCDVASGASQQHRDIRV